MEQKPRVHVATSLSPVGSLSINSRAKEGPDSATKGWRGFRSAWGIIWAIILRVFNSRPLLRDMNGNPGSTYSATLSRKDALNCNDRNKDPDFRQSHLSQMSEAWIHHMFFIWLQRVKLSEASIITTTTTITGLWPF